MNSQKKYFYPITLLFSVSLFILSPNLNAQNDDTNDFWQSSNEWYGPSTILGDNSNTARVGINTDASFVHSTLYVSPLDSTEGIIMGLDGNVNGRIGFHSFGGWFGSYMTGRPTTGGACTLEFYTLTGGWNENAGPPKLIIQPDHLGGNLGMGVINPYYDARLHIRARPDSRSIDGWATALTVEGRIAVGAASGNGNPGAWIGAYDDANGDGIFDNNDANILQNAANLGFFVAWAPGGTGGPPVHKPKMLISGSPDRWGFVGINTVSPQYRLDVCGTIRGKEVIIEQVCIPDYVFEPDYKLATLEEEEEFINKNGHLKGFQSAEEMDASIQVGDYSTRLHQKIEEMMLHMIDINKRLETVETENEKLKAENERLKKQTQKP